MILLLVALEVFVTKLIVQALFAIRRIVIWSSIPLRIVWELYMCLSGSKTVVPQRPLAKIRSLQADGKVAADFGDDLSVNPEQKELWQHEADKSDWWQENSPLTALHHLNYQRVRLVGEAYLKNTQGLDTTWEESLNKDNTFLTGVKVCDVGCGGGILSEALAKCGATVTGVDMLHAAITIAKLHWKESHPNDEHEHNGNGTTSLIKAPEYVCQALEPFAEKRDGQYDVVICSEVLEHVTDPVAFAANCCKLVRPGGCVVFTTVNRTIWALLGFIIIPEDVLGIMPRFCHHLHMCVKPEEIQRATDQMGFQVVKTSGLVLVPMGLQPRDTKWFSTSFTGMGYAMVAQRPE